MPSDLHGYIWTTQSFHHRQEILRNLWSMLEQTSIVALMTALGSGFGRSIASAAFRRLDELLHHKRPVQQIWEPDSTTSTITLLNEGLFLVITAVVSNWTWPFHALPKPDSHREQRFGNGVVYHTQWRSSARACSTQWISTSEIRQIWTATPEWLEKIKGTSPMRLLEANHIRKDSTAFALTLAWRSSAYSQSMASLQGVSMRFLQHREKN